MDCDAKYFNEYVNFFHKFNILIIGIILTASRIFTENGEFY